MAPDLIRCPGCGVKMDLSTFAIRPDQVVCPRCSTRAVVPPLTPVSTGGQQAAQAQAPNPFLSQPVPAPGFGQVPAYAPYMNPVVYTMQMAPTPTFTVPLSMPAPMPQQMPPANWQRGPQNQMPLQQPARPQPQQSQAAAPAQQAAGAGALGAPRPFSMPGANGRGQGPSQAQPQPQPKPQPQRQAASQPDPFATSSFFKEPAKSFSQSPAILPIDAKGNTEPFAFALIGLLSVFALFPPMGIILCIVALMMASDERSRGLYNAYRGRTILVAVLGIVANLVLLVAEAAFIASLVMYPPALLSLFL